MEKNLKQGGASSPVNGLLSTQNQTQNDSPSFPIFSPPECLFGLKEFNDHFTFTNDHSSLSPPLNSAKHKAAPDAVHFQNIDNNNNLPAIAMPPTHRSGFERVRSGRSWSAQTEASHVAGGCSELA